MLSWTILRVIRIDRDSHRLERADHIVDYPGRLMHANCAETQRLVGCDPMAVHLFAQDEFVLQRRLDSNAMSGGEGDHPLQEAARAGTPGLPIEGQEVCQHGGRMWSEG